MWNPLAPTVLPTLILACASAGALRATRISAVVATTKRSLRPTAKTLRFEVPMGSSFCYVVALALLFAKPSPPYSQGYHYPLTWENTRGLALKPKTNQEVEGSKPVFPGDLFTLRVGPPVVGNRNLVDAVFLFRHLHRHLHLEAEALGLDVDAL